MLRGNVFVMSVFLYACVPVCLLSLSVCVFIRAVTVEADAIETFFLA